ncbi:MAG: hypothetical protein J6B60_03975 [Clostridia bacterium]|nr:hypothetical protein [Clostridia bacterium]
MARYLFFERSYLFNEFEKICEEYIKNNPQRRIISLASFDFSLDFLKKEKDKNTLTERYIELNMMFFEDALRDAEALFTVCKNHFVIRSKNDIPSFDFFKAFLNEGQLILFPSDALVTNIKSSLILTPFCSFNECASACARIKRLIKTF